VAYSFLMCCRVEKPDPCEQQVIQPDQDVHVCIWWMDDELFFAYDSLLSF
jgi:hypothetical protein